MVDYTNGTQANATGATTRKFTCVNKMPVRGAKMGDTVEKARAKVEYLLSVSGSFNEEESQMFYRALDIWNASI